MTGSISPINTRIRAWWRSDTLSAAQRAEVAKLREALLVSAERVELPSRFAAIPLPDRPAVRIVNLVTRRETVVALSGYREVRQALADLYPD